MLLKEMDCEVNSTKVVERRDTVSVVTPLWAFS